jgi:hypothetical protein
MRQLEDGLTHHSLVDHQNESHEEEEHNLPEPTTYLVGLRPVRPVRRPGRKTAVICSGRGSPVRQGARQEVLTDGCRPSYPLRPSTGDFNFIFKFWCLSPSSMARKTCVEAKHL